MYASKPNLPLKASTEINSLEKKAKTSCKNCIFNTKIMIF